MQVDLVIAIILAAALALIVGMVSRFLTISGLKKNAESKIGNAEAKAREIIDDAVKTAETTKKEALLEVKEESIKTKNDLEKETKERRAELQRYEKRVLAKEEAVDKRSDAFEQREVEAYGERRPASSAGSEGRRAESETCAGTGTNLRTYLRTGKRISVENC